MNPPDNENLRALPARADSAAVRMPTMNGIPAVIKKEWDIRSRSQLREYLEVVGVLGLVTALGLILPLTYHTLGLIYLLVVVALCLRVGRWPVLAAAILSAVVWDYVFMPPLFSFALPDSPDGLLLGTYVVVALVAGQLTAQIRTQQRQERLRERRATALYHVIRATTEARTLDEAIDAALRQADGLFNARTSLMLGNAGAAPFEHRASSLKLNEKEAAIADWVHLKHLTAGRFTNHFQATADLYLPLLRAGKIFGVFVIRLPADMPDLPPMQRDLIEGFAAQLALLIEREELRAAGEREKLLAESDRLRRTLLDSVSHELKTPLAVLRSAGEKLDTEDAKKRSNLVHEVRTATRRLDHLVANLLNQTRLESGAIHANLDWCEARDLITAARRAMSEAMVGRDFRMVVPEDMPLFMADTPLMEQVLGNLLLNATLHTPGDSPIIVTAGQETRAGTEWVFIRVADRGPGIPPEQRETLFQKFRRGRTARAGGLGLGLAIARGFMLAQGGDITVGDNPEGGARFTVYLPHILPESIPNDER